MAVYKLFPSKDATINSRITESNHGLDAILEVSQQKNDLTTPHSIIANRDTWDQTNYVWVSSSISESGTPPTQSITSGSFPSANFTWNNTPTTTESVPLAINRYLVEFDQYEIEEVFDNYVGSANWDAHLKNFIAYAEGIDEHTILEIFPIAYEWENGTGQTGDTRKNTDGVSWRNRIKRGRSNRLWVTSSFGPYVTGSSLPTIPGGGNWYSGSSDPSFELPVTVEFSTRTFKDLDVDVSQIVDVWNRTQKRTNLYTTIHNRGFIVKLAERQEINSSLDVQPLFRFFSVDTNTIYPPTLEIKWEDYNHSTTLPEITTQDIFVALDNNQGEFNTNAINKFRLNVRPEFPVRTYQTESYYTQNHVLPTASYYAIKDLDTDEYVVDFDKQYTKISADDISNYFNVHMNGLEPERYYKILIKTEINNETIVKDEKYHFKVING